MTETLKYHQFIEEVKSFEWERTTLNRDGKIKKYLADNFEPIPLLRLPKYNQLNGDYEKFITKLRSDAYNEILLFENYKIEKVLYRLQEIEMQFNKFWEIWKKLSKSVNGQTDKFDYSEVISKMYIDFGIIDFNKTGHVSNDFNGSFGLITKEFLKDLYDAILIKDGQLNRLINDLENYLKPIETPAPAIEQRGFDLGLAEPQLTLLYKELMDKTFLSKNTEQEHFINAFNGCLLNDDFKPLKWIEPTAGAICFHHLTAGKPKWKAIEHLFEPANYKNLLNQSKQNGTFERTISKLKSIL